eukprot:m.539451 g.539451  ORF g.539451 m.539451 type:complete len:67 (-) comp57633_c3_seq3:6-206(-)
MSTVALSASSTCRVCLCRLFAFNGLLPDLGRAVLVSFFHLAAMYLKFPRLPKDDIAAIARAARVFQ